MEMPCTPVAGAEPSLAAEASSQQRQRHFIETDSQPRHMQLCLTSGLQAFVSL